MVFNLLILGIAGNVGVAAYGVIANVSLIAISVFNGAAVSLCLAGAIILLTNLPAEHIVQVFDSEGNEGLAAYAVHGMRLSFAAAECITAVVTLFATKKS